MSAAEVIAVALDSMPADTRPSTLVNRDRADIALNALTASGYAIVKLPTPADDGHWRIAGTDLEVRLDRGVLRVRFGSPTRPSTIDKGYHASVGPDLAAALLAAANATEKAK